MCPLFGSRGSAVDIADCYYVDGQEFGLRVLVRARFSLLHVVQTGFGLTQPHVQCVPGALSPGREIDHSSPTSAEVKNTWIYTSTPPYALMV
jgi:hypothetical protein